MEIKEQIEVLSEYVDERGLRDFEDVEECFRIIINLLSRLADGKKEGEK